MTTNVKNKTLLDHSELEICHHAYSGVNDLPRGPYDPLEAVERLRDLAEHFRRLGYEVLSHGKDVKFIEVSTPPNAAMVGDVEGLYVIHPRKLAAYECYHCGELNPVGENCCCLDNVDDERGEL